MKRIIAALITSFIVLFSNPVGADFLDRMPLDERNMVMEYLADIPMSERLETLQNLLGDDGGDLQLVADDGGDLQ